MRSAPISVTEVTFYRWRKEYGGLTADQLKRLRELENEHERLRRAASEVIQDYINTLSKLIFRNAAHHKFTSTIQE